MPESIKQNTSWLFEIMKWCKRRAWATAFWQASHKEIDEKVATCLVCQLLQHENMKEILMRRPAAVRLENKLAHEKKKKKTTTVLLLLET